MKTTLIKGRDHSSLQLVFLGFGQDLTPYGALHLKTDTLFVYDYEDNAADFSVIDDYKEIKVLAWSLGVMMAEALVPSFALKPKKLTAFNGTPCGIDDKGGVDSGLYLATLENLSEDNMRRFYKRMCGRGAEFAAFAHVMPQRTLDSFCRELLFLKEMSVCVLPETQVWDEAYIGLKDAIISPLNQKRGWKGRALRIIEFDASHYSAAFFKDKLE